MSPPKSIKDVQNLAERLVALNWFISRSANRGLPFFKVLRGVANFQWNKTSQEAFNKLKKYLVLPPLLTKRKTRETLYLYLAVSESAISSFLVLQESKEHHLLHYVSKVPQGAEVRYSQIEKASPLLSNCSKEVKALLPVAPSDSVNKPSLETSVI
ncbi:UNVERIFIED_CONTAM: hypothetical protein Slati_0137200 [Sesamum latifolium]|uniref:Reverse transcriptase/retrotransposon-derived protein RNase H-like domain-containing protein n=1 Tax=Sesamum latifolium TaxID=2727402 RepID=A0AAW2Y9Y1_9LAMI